MPTIQKTIEIDYSFMLRFTSPERCPRLGALVESGISDDDKLTASFNGIALVVCTEENCAGDGKFTHCAYIKCEAVPLFLNIARAE